MKNYHFPIHLSQNQFVDYYRGRIQHMVARCADGRTVQFPAALLKRFITPQGIHGNFVLTCDDNNKVIELQRLDV